MFAVIYRAYIKNDHLEKYKTSWHILASYFKQHRGALGACLHQAEDGMWVAYSRWPNKATRDASWPGDNAPADILPVEVKQAIFNIKASIDQSRPLPDICMEVIEDLL